MNEVKQTSPELEVQVVDLGDAKEVTMGFPANAYLEDNPQILARF